MRFFPVFAVGLSLMAQTPPKSSSKPPVAATPVVGSTPAVGPEGNTIPMVIKPPVAIPPDRVVIQVGDLKLTQAQMDQILKAYSETQRVYVNGPGRDQFIDQVVRVLLLSEEARRRKLAETDLYKTQLMYSAAGILANHLDEDVKAKSHLDEPALKAYYEAHKSDWDLIHVYHILIRMQGSPMPVPSGQPELSEADALAKALEIRQKIVDGAKFEDLARTESNDPGTNAKGGDLGLLKRGQTVPAFDDAAFSLPVGELSQPVKTNYGYHLIKVAERQPAKPLNELRAEIEKKIALDASRKFLEDLKANAKIVIDDDFKAPANASLEIKQ